MYALQSLAPALPVHRSKIAIIGAGAAGLSAAWLLSPRHDVTLFEREARPGGHANTVNVQDGAQPIDTGFIVYNEQNYPNFTALLSHIGTATEVSDMSFAVSLDNGRAEYSSVSVDGFMNGGANLFRPRFWRMTSDLLRFYGRAAGQDRPREDEMHLTLGEYLDRHGYGAAFQKDHLLPQAAAIWSATLEDIRAYPACAFIRFFDNHGLLKLKGRSVWRTVKGGSRNYVSRLFNAIGDVRLACAALRVDRSERGVAITDVSGEVSHFDEVVIATHADEALRLLGHPSARERQLLSAFAYSKNRAVLHTDATLMPRNKRVWASWNYVGVGDASPCGVTYWMNRLQNIPGPTQYFLSLNPNAPIRPSQILWEGDYDHPIFNTAALKAQQDIWSLQGQNRTWYCGAHLGAGFHEDAVQAGLAVAEQLGGVRRPWTVADESGRIFVRARSTESERQAA